MDKQNVEMKSELRKQSGADLQDIVTNWDDVEAVLTGTKKVLFVLCEFDRAEHGCPQAGQLWHRCGR
jgi:hypothetical protein